MADLQTEQRLEDLENRLDALLTIPQLPNGILPSSGSYFPIYNIDTAREEKIKLEGLYDNVLSVAQDLKTVFNFTSTGTATPVISLIRDDLGLGTPTPLRVAVGLFSASFSITYADSPVSDVDYDKNPSFAIYRSNIPQTGSAARTNKIEVSNAQTNNMILNMINPSNANADGDGHTFRIEVIFHKL